jgi:hypothetical protein
MTAVVHGQAQTEVRDHAGQHGADGMDCPECSAFVQVYRWRIDAVMARDLLLCHQRFGTDPFFLPEVAGRINPDFLRLKHWGLISASDETEMWWNVTAEGERWLLGKSYLPKYAMFYNGCLMKMTEGNRVTVSDVLGREFSYRAA